jgi:multidrug resistance efflux pump
LVIKPPQQPVPAPEKHITLKGSQVAIAQTSVRTGYSLLQGQLTVLADRAASAPVAGMVARHLAEPGDSVKRGQAVMEISVGAAVRPAPAAEIKQSAAEKHQVNAVDEQNQLADKISAAREQLEIADARVRKAEQRVAAARELVKQVQTGGSAPAPRAEVPTPAPGKPSAATLAAAQKAQQEVQQSQKALDAAQQKLADAERDARNAADALKKATANIDKVEDLFQKGSASGDDVESARSAAVEAQEKVTAANNAAFAARQEVTKQEKRLATAKDAAAKADAKAAANLKEVKVFEDAPQATTAPAGNSSPTLEQAAREVKAALDESRAASKEAESLHARIDSYEQQVKSSQSRVEAAAQELQSAQQQVLDSMPKPKFVPVAAPVDGIIAWIAPLAREVGPGQSVFGLSRGQLTATFPDTTGAWKKLQVGATMPALIPAQATDGATPTATPLPSAVPAAKPSGTLATLTVTSIKPPAATGQPANIQATVKLLSPATPEAPLRPGAKLLASLTQEPVQGPLQIPASAVMMQDWKRYVAVLENADPTDTKSREFDVVWKPVKIGGSADGRVVVTEGLEPGDRVVRTPEILPKPTEDTSDLIAVVES